MVKIHWRKLKIFFSRTTEPFSTKLVTMHPWVKGIQVCLNEGPNPFPRGDYYKIRQKYIDEIKKKSLFQNHWVNFNQFLHKASLGEDSNEKTISYHKVYFFSSSLNQRCVYWFELFSQVSDVAHGPLV